jgi:hypothetical protein
MRAHACIRMLKGECASAWDTSSPFLSLSLVRSMVRRPEPGAGGGGVR